MSGKFFMLLSRLKTTLWKFYDLFVCNCLARGSQSHFLQTLPECKRQKNKTKQNNRYKHKKPNFINLFFWDNSIFTDIYFQAEEKEEKDLERVEQNVIARSCVTTSKESLNQLSVVLLVVVASNVFLVLFMKKPVVFSRFSLNP